MKNVEISKQLLNFLTHNSIKVRDREELFDYLKHYLSNIKPSVHFGYILKEASFVEFYDGHIEFEKEDILDEIKSLDLDSKVVGEIVFSKNKKYAFIPTYEKEDSFEILVLAKTSNFDEVINDLLVTNIKNIHIYRQLKEKTQALFNLANTDEVTGLYNQRKLNVDLESTIEEHEKNNESFSLMFIDVDHFKRVNDNYGHVIGSRMLTELGKELKNQLRDSDDVYRYGGDEFIVIMRKVKIKVVQKIALRILGKIKEKEFKLDDNEIYKLSVSIGIAEFPTDAKTSVEIIKFADEMMYESKQSGRGKVFHLGKEVSDARTRS